MGVFAIAEWVPIPASPLGAAASGPVQSNDNRYLWWWTGTQIAAFDCRLWKWAGPWAWDGFTIVCASQAYASRVIFSAQSQAGAVTYRLFSMTAGAYSNCDWLSSSDYYNSRYAGYEGPFSSPIAQFGFDPGIPDRIVGIICDGLGPGVTAFVTAYIENGFLANGIFLNEQFGTGSLVQLSQGGIQGNAYYGFILAGDEYVTIPNLPHINWGAIAAVVIDNPPLDLQNQMQVTSTPEDRTYTFGQAQFLYPDPFEYAGSNNFQDNLYNLITDGNGGFAGPNAILLTETKTGNGNPETFTYAEVIYTNYGGTFGTPFPVSYSPVGDNPLHMCGYAQQVIVGQLGSTEWYYLAIAQTSLQIRTVVNYLWAGGPQST